eukprot:1522794-Rhodomonas_salina.1
MERERKAGRHRAREPARERESKRGRRETASHYSAGNARRDTALLPGSDRQDRQETIGEGDLELGEVLEEELDLAD